MAKQDFPGIHFYDQDFVDIYDKTWAWLGDCWNVSGTGTEGGISGDFFSHPGSGRIRQDEAIYSSFFLVYSNMVYQATPTLDLFYERQEEDGAIRNAYDIASGLPAADPENPEGLGIPLFAWAEHNIYHKSANKKRLKDVMGVLHRYSVWVEANFRAENGLYRVPLGVTGMVNSPREDVCYSLDFSAMMAINALYMSAMADILNDKDSSIHYKTRYFGLKTAINSLMWDSGTGFYHDLDREGNRIPVMTIGAYWTLLAELPNDEKAERLISKLGDPRYFGSEHPFPSLSRGEPSFSEEGGGYCGSVFPHLTYMVIK
ncbi:MAG: hypothetical protein FWD94_05800, partial [Treponema sp.]|nr:hypothetical protein [Treponema sp.]